MHKITTFIRHGHRTIKNKGVNNKRINRSNSRESYSMEPIAKF